MTPSWNLTPREAIALQKRLQKRIRSTPIRRTVRTIAGADISWDPTSKKGYAGVIVYRWPGLEEVERASAEGLAPFPYVPGLLSFREGPLLMKAFERLRTAPDLIFFDGHGLAHPRRLGVASHLGLLLKTPAIGCAKSKLVGDYIPPENRVGATSPLTHEGDTVGYVLRTKKNTQPLFISVGHRTQLAEALQWTLACSDGSRIPKPTREADRWVDQLRRADIATRKSHAAA